MLTKAKQPSEFFADIIRVARLVSGAVGADISNPKYRINWITLIVISSIVGYFIFTITTVWKMFEENWTYMLEASCMVGSVLQGCAKLIYGIVHTKKITAIRFLLERIYKDYEQRGPKYCAALNASTSKVRRVLTVIGVSYFISILAIVTMPIILLVVNGNRHLMMHFHIPGVDVETTAGYFVTLGAHFICMFAGSFGLYAGDLFVLIYLTQSFLFVDIFELKIAELNEHLDAAVQSNKNNGSNAKKRTSSILIDIVEWHQQYLDFTKECNQIFSVIVSVQVTTAGVSILLTLYVVVTGNWPGAYPFLLISIYALYVYCILGTKIENCNDNFCDAIYNISWYNLTVPDQKIVRLMLMQSQSPNTIKVAGVMPLSVNTALQITKTIYSMFMMMIKFLTE